MIRRLFALTILLITASVLFTSCSMFFQPEPEEKKERVDRAETYGPPLPADASVEAAGQFPAEPDLTDNLIGSLRPGDATPGERIPEILERGRIIIGVDQSQYLLSYRDSVTGDLQGFEIDLAREISRDIFGDPSRVEFRFVDSFDRVSTLSSGEVDLVIRNMSVTEKRQNEVLFSAPYLSAETRLLVMAHSGVNSFDSLPGQTVCVADNSTGLETAREYAPHSPILKTRNWADCLVALQQHQAQAIISDDYILSGITAQDPYTTIVGESPASSEYGVAAAHPRVSELSEDLIRQVNATMERIREDGTWWRMYDRWFSAYLSTSGQPPLNYRAEEEPYQDTPAAETTETSEEEP
ncbi:ABC transporter glutamine-binding protein GlnH precursor [Corynebacterium occultum]|uniref:ABC transporter glutamine-binding protein GlnH n=1 Tax=Corynebacterium occultum TaxID=2675219 RepID=A0A6B8WAQ6_9CORY|nr:glutamate ABC transporter substrate-binding protein [Corynebacterium occultum]QGU08375.1 ABC transporter glutamine-binding protein GlnH precursor [Corynebacterium occultum]